MLLSLLLLFTLVGCKFMNEVVESLEDHAVVAILYNLREDNIFKFYYNETEYIISQHEALPIGTSTLKFHFVKLSDFDEDYFVNFVKSMDIFDKYDVIFSKAEEITKKNPFKDRHYNTTASLAYKIVINPLHSIQ